MSDGTQPPQDPAKTAPDGAESQEAENAPLPQAVAFKHPFFTRLDDIFFRLDDTTSDPVAVVTLGEEKLILPFPGLRREFKLDDTEDGAMLALLAKGLKYVKGLRIGDPLPAEITTRKASWKPQLRHRQIAYHRLAMQLMGWLSGDEHIITNPDELLQVAGDPTFKRKINEAFGEAAVALGLGRENREQVVGYIADLSDELAYVEAMRDQFHTMQEADGKIQLLRRKYGAERSVLEVVDPVARLMERAVADFADTFEQTDANTGEIMAVLKNIDAQKSYIQDMRDALHIRLMPWEDLLDEWSRLPARKSKWAEDLLARTYRFLAPRYMPTDEWQMMTKLVGAGVTVTADGKVVSGAAPKKKGHGGVMEWI